MKTAANLFLVVSSLVNTNWRTSKHSFYELSFYTRRYSIFDNHVLLIWSKMNYDFFSTNKRLSWLTCFAIMVACPIWKIFICLLNIITSAYNDLYDLRIAYYNFYLTNRQFLGHAHIVKKRSWEGRWRMTNFYDELIYKNR